MDLLGDWIDVIWEVHGDGIVPLLLEEMEAPPEVPGPDGADDIPF